MGKPNDTTNNVNLTAKPYFISDRDGKFTGAGANATVSNNNHFVSAGGYRHHSGYTQGQVQAGTNFSNNTRGYVEAKGSNTGTWYAGIGLNFKF